MMKMRTLETAVGAFVLAGILSLLMLALQVSGLNNFFREEPGFKVKAEFANIGGLKIKAKVTVGGVVVGRVVQVTLEPTTFVATVLLSIDSSKVKNLPLDTHASILTAGLLGDNYISLTPGFDDERFLKEGDVIPLGSTDSAIVLEQLISKFVAGQVSSNKPSR